MTSGKAETFAMSLRNYEEGNYVTTTLLLIQMGVNSCSLFLGATALAINLKDCTHTTTQLQILSFFCYI